MSAVLAEKPKSNPMLSPGRLQPFAHRNQIHNLTAEENTPFEAVLDPQYYAHLAPKLRMYDEIRVTTDEGAYYARLLVLAVGQTWAKVRKLEFFDLMESESAAPADPMNPYYVKFRGPVLKWSMLRRADNAVIREGMETRGEAERYMGDHVRVTT
jgi:hypothetical protein